MPLSVVQTERTEHERRCLCGGLNLFSDTLYNNWLMICSGKRESRRFLTTKEYNPWVSGQFSTLPMTHKRVKKECGSGVKTAVSSLKEGGHDLTTFHLNTFMFVTSKFCKLQPWEAARARNIFKISYEFNEAFEINGFRVWDTKRWFPKIPIRYQHFDVNSDWT